MKLKKAIDKLKKQMKRKRSWLLAGLIPLLLLAVLLYLEMRVDKQELSSSEATLAELDEVSKREVILHKLYLCGEQHESLGFYSELETESLKRGHPDWRLEGIDELQVIYAVEVDDLSPSCRDNAYFGLDRNNSLTLYEGKPGEGKIVRTYFQVDVTHLENSLPNETVEALRGGIKVSDFAEYNSVLSTFSDYALPSAEQVYEAQD